MAEIVKAACLVCGKMKHVYHRYEPQSHDAGTPTPYVMFTRIEAHSRGVFTKEPCPGSNQWIARSEMRATRTITRSS